MLIVLKIHSARTQTSLLVATELNSNVFSNETNQNHSLRVATFNYEPFMCQNKNGQLVSGVEFELVKTIGKMENLNVSFELFSRIDKLRFDFFIYI